jgi:hypothetical protein
MAAVAPAGVAAAEVEVAQAAGEVEASAPEAAETPGVHWASRWPPDVQPTETLPVPLPGKRSLRQVVRALFASSPYWLQRAKHRVGYVPCLENN